MVELENWPNGQTGPKVNSLSPNFLEKMNTFETVSINWDANKVIHSIWLNQIDFLSIQISKENFC